MIDKNNLKLRDDMVYLLGQIEALTFPLMWSKDEVHSQAYYDLIDSIKEQYIRILEQTIGYKG